MKEFLSISFQIFRMAFPVLLRFAPKTSDSKLLCDACGAEETAPYAEGDECTWCGGRFRRAGGSK